MRILGVNGIWNPDSGKTSFTDQLLTPLKFKGYRVRDISYRRMLALKAYIPQEIEKRALLVIDAYEPGDAVIAHSFGCLLTITAMKLGARFGKVFFFGAAVSQDAEIPPNYEHLYNIHSPSDGALWLGTLLPFHPFGGMGKWGYRGKSPNVTNVEAPGMGHNDYVEPENIEKWLRFIDRKLRPPRKKAA